MLVPVIIATLHYIAVFLLVGAVFAQMYLLKLPPNADTVRGIARTDIVFGIGAVAILITGFGNAAHAKGMAYYFHNGAFHLALTLFIVSGLLSIAPTIRYLRWKKAVNAGLPGPSEAEWKAQRKWPHIHLTLFAIIAACMAMMARGVMAGS
jgi:putative membrane protein